MSCEDDDNDGFPDLIDVFPNNMSEWNDTDGDGTGDNSDLDIDGDEYDNDVDAFPWDYREWNDTDGDGLGDNDDPDDDNDGVPDKSGDLSRDRNNNNNGIYDIGEFDEFPFDPLEWVDTDGDKIGNSQDPDDDDDGVYDWTPGMLRDRENNNDGIYDDGIEYDEFPFEPSTWVDTDGDAIGNLDDVDDDGDGYWDNIDEFDRDSTEWNDLDGDAIGDNSDPDIDGDNHLNAEDAFPWDSTEWNDLDGDGIGNNSDDDVDGDGSLNIFDVFDYDPTEWNDLDGDGIGNNSDPNIDGDEFLNMDDAFPWDPLEWSDLDGDGIGDNSDDDVDGDGHSNAIDRFPTNATEWNDLDNDGIGDNTDLDIDGDNHVNTKDSYAWDSDEHEETSMVLGYTMNMGQSSGMNTVLIPYSILLTALAAFGYFFMSKPNKEPFYLEKIQKVGSVPKLDSLFGKMFQDRKKGHIDDQGFSMLENEAQNKRVELGVNALASLNEAEQLELLKRMMTKEDIVDFLTHRPPSDMHPSQQPSQTTTHPQPSDQQSTPDQSQPPPVVPPVGTQDQIGPVAETATPVDKVHFTVTSPPVVKPASYFVVDLWAHLEHQLETVLKEARDMAGDEKIAARTVGPEPVKRGTVLTAELDIKGVIIEYPVNKILWEGEIGNANFPAQVPEDAAMGSRPGVVKISIEGLQVAMIHFVIKIGEDVSEVTKLETSETRVKKAFASYASADRELVLPRIQGIQKAVPSIEIFFDVLSIRSGQDWEKQIHDIIPNNDVFYLFWSQNAMRSQWVESEWRCALETKGIDFIDPVPLVPPNVAPPPEELAAKHFNDWTLAFMRTQPPSPPT